MVVSVGFAWVYCQMALCRRLVGVLTVVYVWDSGGCGGSVVGLAPAGYFNWLVWFCGLCLLLFVVLCVGYCWCYDLVVSVHLFLWFGWRCKPVAFF